MNEYIKQSIDARKSALESAGEISAEFKKKVEALFAEIEKLGVKCKDVSEFEEKFSKSSLNKKYTDLFTEIATKTIGVGAKVANNVAGGIASGVADRIISEAVNSALPTRAAVHQKVSDVARSVPVLGDVIDEGQKASYLGHLAKVFKKRK